MTTTRSVTIPGNEWEQVRKRVVPFSARDFVRPVLRATYLTVRDGRRIWSATDSYTAVRFRGGKTKSGDAGPILLDRDLFTPARPKPAKVKITWNRSTVNVAAPNWDDPRTCETLDRKPPDLDALFDKHTDRDGDANLILDRVPESEHDKGYLPVVAYGSDGVYARPNGTWTKIGTALNVGVAMVAINDRLARRCFKAVESDDRCGFVQVNRALDPVVWSSVGIEILQMPMRAPLDLFIEVPS